MDGAFHTTLPIFNPDDTTEKENTTYGHMREKNTRFGTLQRLKPLYSLSTTSSGDFSLNVPYISL